MKDSKKFASDSFFTPSGEINTMSSEPLSVVFLGGSLTAGDIDYEGTPLTDWNMKWPNTVLRFLSGLFPGRKIEAHNAGLGGTGSEYGSIRFSKDVARFKPDLVFIEFSVNDCGGSATKKRYTVKESGWSLKYLESMLRQCMELEKVPTVIYAHCPFPVEPDSNKYRQWRAGALAKNELLKYYGIEPIDIYAAICKEYDALHAKDESLTFEKFLGGYYRKNNEGEYDVHPHAWGYKFYNLAIVNAIAKHPEKYLRAFIMRDELYCKGEEKTINERFVYVPYNDPKITYHGDFRTYDSEHPFVTDNRDISIPEGQLRNELSFPLGVTQIMNPVDASFEFDTVAERICFPHVSARKGLGATVLSDGKEIGKFTCNSIYHGMNYTGSWIFLGNKGIKKHITVKIDNTDGENCVFRYGYIVESV